HRPPPWAPTLAQGDVARNMRDEARVRAIALPHGPPPSRKAMLLAICGTHTARRSRALRLHPRALTTDIGRASWSRHGGGPSPLAKARLTTPHSSPYGCYRPRFRM